MEFFKKAVDKSGTLCYYTGALRETKANTYGRVVELVDSLDSGSSVHCGRAGSSPASPTKKDQHYRCFFEEVNIYSVFLLFQEVLTRRKHLVSHKFVNMVFGQTIDVF